MSSAFVKQDIDEPERPMRRRSSSGLPPGALNFMTASGAVLLQQRLAELIEASVDASEIEALKDVLESATIVKQPDRSEGVVFGARVTLKSAAGETRNYRIVGVDEIDLESENVSWVSAIGKALLGAQLAQRLGLGPEIDGKWTVVKID
ncbi:MAG: GreA/GreB family elongation factor [Fimbriimonadaceae bacterium]